MASNALVPTTLHTRLDHVLRSSLRVRSRVLRRAEPYLYITPALLSILIFVYLPLIRTIRLSTTAAVSVIE